MWDTKCADADALMKLPQTIRLLQELPNLEKKTLAREFDSMRRAVSVLDSLTWAP